MKLRKFLALALSLTLCAGLLAAPASALSSDDAKIYLEKVESAKGSSYLVDFDGDGREELLVSRYAGSNLVDVWQGGQNLGNVTDYYAGTMGDDDLYLARKDGKAYLAHHVYMYRGLSQSLTFYTVEKGKLVEKWGKDYEGIQTYSPEELEPSYAWEQLEYTAEAHSVASQLKDAATQSAAPQPSAVPAAPQGGTVPAPAEAIAHLAGISYVGDRSAIAMTPAQAEAIRAQIALYTAAAPSLYNFGQAQVYVALFDAGAGVPGVLMAKGYGGGPTVLDKGTLYFEMGEAALWSFQGGKTLVPLAGAAPDASFALYPSCVGCGSGAPDGSYWETRYYTVENGALPSEADHVLASGYDGTTGDYFCTVNGQAATEQQYDQTQAQLQGTGAQASATPGGGVEYLIKNMTPADQVTAALERYAGALAVPKAYPSTQNVELDGVAVEFQCYALKDEKGNETNYIKLRDLALLLNGTGAQFDVGWDGAVSVTTGKAYTPNGTELKAPFSGERTYRTVADPTLVDGAETELSAFVLTDDQGGGYTYYKLRDLGQALGFAVDWTAERGVFIETK